MSSTAACGLLRNLAWDRVRLAPWLANVIAKGEGGRPVVSPRVVADYLALIVFRFRRQDGSWAGWNTASHRRLA